MGPLMPIGGDALGIFSRIRARDGRAMRVSYGPRATAILGRTTAEMYRTQPALRAVVGYISENVAAVPLKCYERRGENDRPRDSKSPLALLLEHPSEGVTTYELVRDTMADVLLHGWALWYVVPSADTESGWAATRICPEWVTTLYTTGGFRPSSYVVQVPEAGRAPVTIDASDTLSFSLYGASGPLDPASPVDALRQVLAEQVSAWDYRNKVWRNGGWVSRWISRGEGNSWSKEARERFAKSWKERFSGPDGTDSGGTPILEDGMQLHDTQLNAREAQFSESAQLTRQDVAAVYGINPSLIWHTSTQTYASAKDNARALYAETLAPKFDLLCERINKVLAPRLGADGVYCEFDVLSKLNSNPADMISTLVSATQRPVLTGDEARRMLNLPALGGSMSEIVTPLNLMVGGVGASSGEDGGAASAEARGQSSRAPMAKAADDAPLWSVKARADADGSVAMARTLSRFFRRQAKAVLPRIGAAKARGPLAKEDDPEWWDEDRWDSELADDLEPVMKGYATRSGRAAASRMRGDYDATRTDAYLRKVAEGRAHGINAVTRRRLADAIDAEDGEQTPKDVFEQAEEGRADRLGVSMAAAVAVFGVREATEQLAPKSSYLRMKTWVHDQDGASKRPRDDHAAMDGECVEFDKPFSNGAMFPHDGSQGVEEEAYCRCGIDVDVYRL